MNLKKVIFFSISILATISAIILIYLYSLSSATEYCPLSHKLNPDMYCRVCDRLNDKVLIEHFNRDTNQLSLSIFENGNMIWIQHPKGEIINYNLVIEENKISFNKNNLAIIVVNGVNFPITILDHD